MKRINIFFLCLGILFFPICSYAEPIKEIKLAIFDNPEIDSTNLLLSENAQAAYMQGIETAINVAKSKGINIDKKTFFYGDNLLNILQQAPNVKAWGPDVIMGLNGSNAALMSNSLFTEQLVLSISATDVHLSKLPPNFYSLGTPDLYTAKQIVDFISKQYPYKNLFLIIGAESKESVDLGSIVTDLYTQKNPKLNVNKSEFLSDDSNTMNISSLVKGYMPGDIILLFSLAGTYNTQVNLMNKISDFLSPNKLVFMTPVDNWKDSNVLANTNNTTNPYTALRLDTLFIDRSSNAYKAFVKNYEKKFHRKPTDNISFITYQTVNSFISAIEKFPPPKQLSTKQAILWSYQKAIKHDPNWFRFNPIVIYKIEGHKEMYFTSLPVK